MQALADFVSSWPGATLVGFLIAACVIAGLRCLQAGQQGAVFVAETAGGASGATDSASRTLAVHEEVNSNGLALQLLLTVPSVLGISEWKAGDYGQYQRSIRGEDWQLKLWGWSVATETSLTVTVLRQVLASDAIVAQGHAEEGHWWLRFQGLRAFRGEPNDMFVLGTPDDLRSSPRAPQFAFKEGYIPEYLPYPDLRHAAPLTEHLGRERCETPAGVFDCERLRVTIGDQELEIWASSQAPPLGIVKLQSSTDELILTGRGRHGRTARCVNELAPSMVTLLDGRSALTQSCLACHPDAFDCHKLMEPGI